MSLEQYLKKIDKNQLRINGVRPLEQERVLNLKDYFKIGLTYTSNAIEGSTLTESETKVVIEDGVTIGGKPLKDHFDAVGHARAFEYMWKLAQKSHITEDNIKQLHKICFQLKDGENAGQYRKHDVVISGSAYNDKLSKFEDIPAHMKGLVASLPNKQADFHPVVYAAALHREFINIHPFPDGNGRTARLLMNHALIAKGYPPVIIPPAFKHEYIQALEKSRGTNKDFFSPYVAERVIEAQRDYIRLLRIPEINPQKA